MNKDSGNNYTVDVNIEQKKREIKQEYVNFLDDSVSTFMIGILILFFIIFFRMKKEFILKKLIV